MKKTFENKIYFTGLIFNLFSALMIFIFSSFFIVLKPQQVKYALLISGSVFLFEEFILSNILTRLLSKKISVDIEKWRHGNMGNPKEKTLLVKELTYFPVKKAGLTFISFVLFLTSMRFIYEICPLINIDRNTGIISYVACLSGAYTAALIAFSYSEQICNKYSEKIIADGISTDDIIKQKKSGIPLSIRCIIFLICPVIISNTLIFIIAYQGYFPTNGIIINPEAQIKRIIIMSIINVTMSFIQYFIYYFQINKSISTLKTNVTDILQNGLGKKTLRTNLGDQLQYNIFLLNSVIKKYSAIIRRANSISKETLNTTSSLSSISEKISEISIEQSKDVKEILSKMESANMFSQNITSQISAVSDGTDKTKFQTTEAVGILKTNVTQIEKINSSNTAIIQNIENLSEQINGIKDIISVIMTLAEQTRIISFNTELESVRAKENGTNFHIIANEIKRVADSTTNSINEIQNKLTVLQNSAATLIKSSKKRSDLITESNAMNKKLELQFDAISATANTTNEKAEEIFRTVEQQTASFNQIVVTLRQISAGIESFTDSTQELSSTAKEIQNAADTLSNLQA